MDMHTANRPNVIPFPGTPALPRRRVIYSRSFSNAVVEVIEQAYVDGCTYLVSRRGIFNDVTTIVGPIYSQAEALRFARCGAV